MEHEIALEIPTGKMGPLVLDFPVFLGIFQWDEPTKRDSMCHMYPVEDCVNLAQNVKM